MKKSSLFLTLAAAGLLAGCSGAPEAPTPSEQASKAVSQAERTSEILSSALPSTANQKPDTQEGLLSVDQAKQIVFKQAQISADQAKFIQVHKDYEKGNLVYEIDFYANDTEYDYTIDAKSGEVIKKSEEAKTAPALAGQNNSSQEISADQAAQIALDQAGIAKEKAQALRTERDLEHGKTFYEVDWYTNGVEYSYTIDAQTGTIVNYEQDFD